MIMFKNIYFAGSQGQGTVFTLRIQHPLAHVYVRPGKAHFGLGEKRGIFYVVKADLLTTTSILGQCLVALSACACTVAQLQVQSLAYAEARNDPLFILLLFSCSFGFSIDPGRVDSASSIYESAMFEGHRQQPSTRVISNTRTRVAYLNEHVQVRVESVGPV
jgi:hypothetical protein